MIQILLSFHTWADEGLEDPGIVEEYNPGRTTLVLSFEKKKQTIKTNDKKQTIKASNKIRAPKTLGHIEEIISYLNNVGEARAADIAVAIGLSHERTRVILAHMEEVEAMGGNRNRTYRLKK